MNPGIITNQRKRKPPVVSNPTVKIPIVKVYNHTLTGNEFALIDNQSSNVQVSGSSDQSIQPTGANSWFNDIPTYLVNPVLITQDNGFTGAFRITALPPEGINYTLRFNGVYNITKICIFIEPQNNGDKGHIIVKSGTPYNFTTTLVDIHDNGSLGIARWFDTNVNTNSRYINLSITNPDCGRIREIVCYGSLVGSTDNVSTYTIPSAPVATNINVNDSIGMNIYHGMGQDFDGITKYDEGWKGGTRTFAAAKYVTQADGTLLHSSGTAGAIEAAFCQRVIASGGKQYYCYGSLLNQDMAETPGDGSDWATQKPIPISLGNIASGQRYNTKLTFNEIATLPSSYAQAAYNLLNLAQANFSIGIREVEPDNEKDGSFKGAGFMYPEQLACMMSVYWDGHNNTVTYNSNPVGLRNYPALDTMKLLSPAFSYISARYFDCMLLWWETHRAGFPKGVYPLDGLSVHAYSGTFEVQFSGAGEAVYPERVDVYNMPLKLDIARNYAYKMGNKPVINTESGFDTYFEVHPNPASGCGNVQWGGSFVAIKDTSENPNPPYTKQAQWTVRNYLLHISKGIPLRMYWLADQARLAHGCGTFNAAGLLEWSDDHGIGVPTYLKKPSWYWVKTLQNRLGDYLYQNQTIIGDYVLQNYQHSTLSNLKAYVVWMKTANGSTSTQTINVPGNYTLINFNNTTTGSDTTGTGSFSLLITETPKIVLYEQ